MILKQGLCAAYLLHATIYESEKLALSQSRGDPLHCGTPDSSTVGPDQDCDQCYCQPLITYQRVADKVMKNNVDRLIKHQTSCES